MGLQPKLKVNEPGDIYEREADRIADQVMAMSAHPAVSSAPPRIQRFSGQSNGQMGAAPTSVDQALASPGRPLEPVLRQDMEQRFGYDFSRVRVHSGAAAEQSAQDVNAHAYTVGHDIVFSASRFAPGTHAGQRLIAHELTHVVQQSGSDGIRTDGSNEKHSLSPVSLRDSHTLRRQEFTPEELRTAAAVVVGALDTQTLTDTGRELLESNLQTLEDDAAAQGIDLAAATAYRLRQVIKALAINLKGLGNELKKILRTEVRIAGIRGSEEEVGKNYSGSRFQPETVWALQQLSWATNALSEASGLTATAEVGGAQSTQQFRAAGTRVTAVLFTLQAVAVHLAFLHVGVVAASDFGESEAVVSQVRLVREDFEPILQELHKVLDPLHVERAVTELQSLWHDHTGTLGLFSAELEEQAHNETRIRQAEIHARSLMPRPGGGLPIAGGVAVAKGAVGSAESLEAMRRLAATGTVSTAAAVGRIGGGTAGNPPMTAKPTLQGQEFTPEELRTAAAVVVGALDTQTLTDTGRQLLESNLQALEDYASAHGIELAVATAYRLRQVIRALAIDLKGLGGELTKILRTEVEYREVGEDAGLSSSGFRPETVWDLQQLSWATNALSEASGLTATAEAGGAQSMQQFRAAGTRVTAALFASQAVAVHLAFLHVGVVAASDFGELVSVVSTVRSVREKFEPMLQELRSLDPSRVERAVTELQSSWDYEFKAAFHAFVEALEETAHMTTRIRQVANIIALVMQGRGLMGPRSGGRPPIAGGPGLSRATAGGGAVAVGAVGSAEWLEAMRRLAAIGAISTAAAVGRIGGGTAGALPMPAKPTLTAAAQVKPTGTPAPTSTGGASASVGPKPLSKAEFDQLPYDDRLKILKEWMKQRGVTRIIDSNDHHAWPKYLGGPEKGPLIGLDEQLHRAFHSALDKELPRSLGTKHYASLSQGQKIRNIKKLKAVARDFDMQWGTKIGERLTTALKGTPYENLTLEQLH